MRADSPAGKKYCIDLLSKLVDISSVFPNEEEVMLFLERELSTLGLKPQRIEVEEKRFNLLCRIGSGSPRICLNAHADTVPVNGESTPNARIDEDILYGLGACDDKASIAAQVTACLDIASRIDEIGGSVDLLVSVDEEGDGKGVKAAIRQGYSCDYAVIGEPSDLDIVRAHNGLIFLSITTLGKAAHGSAPWVGVSAIDRMMELIGEIKEVISEFPSHQDTGPVSLNLGSIKAGDLPNRVPDRCDALVDIRLAPPAKVDKVLGAVREVLDSKEWASYTIDKLGETLDTPADSKLVRTVIESAEEFGLKPRVIGGRGWTEAEPFRTMLGIESLVIGPGSMNQAHSSKEFVSISETQLAAQVYVRIVEKLLAG